jgi:ferredoxin
LIYNFQKGFLMAVVITDTCINCGACIDECPVEAIVDEDDCPTGEEIYFVFGSKAHVSEHGGDLDKTDANICVECVGYHDEPACASACPTEGCIVWDEVLDSPENPNRGTVGEECVEG